VDNQGHSRGCTRAVNRVLPDNFHTLLQFWSLPQGMQTHNQSHSLLLQYLWCGMYLCSTGGLRVTNLVSRCSEAVAG
jgi:hypothetical protein